MNVRKSRAHLAIAFAVLCAMLASTAAWAADDRVSVQILSINDFHGAIQQTKKLGDRPIGGVAYLAAQLKERESGNPNTLLVSAGDTIGASQPVSALLQDEPTLQIMALLGVDVAIPGNHEFDAGVDELMRLQLGGTHAETGYFAGTSYPLIGANIIDKKTGDPILPPYVIKTVGGVPIAFIGITTLATPDIVLPSGIASVDFIDPVTAVNKYIPEIRALGVEAVMLVAHEGGSFNKKTGNIEGPIVAIAEGVDDSVDVIFSGHSHTRLNGVVDGKLIVQAYSSGTAFADVDLIIDSKTDDVVWARGEVQTVFADETQADSRIAVNVDRYVERVSSLIDKVITTARDDITRDKNDAGESALGNLVADAQRWAAKTQIAFMNPGGIRRDFPAGDLTWGMLYEMQPFGNDLLKMTLTGNQIYQLLNQQWQGPYNRFLQTSGIKYTWDDSKAVGSKVTAVYLKDGTPIDRNASYSVVANNYIASGGDWFSVFTEANDQEYVMNDLDALIAYLEAIPQPIDAQIEGRVTKVR